MLSRLQNRQNAGDRTMQTAMREINTVIDRMRLNDAVRNSAYEVFKDVSALSKYYYKRGMLVYVNFVVSKSVVGVSSAITSKAAVSMQPFMSAPA